MDPLLSMIVPVFNDEAVITSQVLGLLDVAAELTSQFEIVIVDDASTDLTEDEARRLSRQYPQIRYLRHRQRAGMISTVRTGLQAGQGELVFVQHARGPIQASQLRQSWQESGLDSPLAAPVPLSGDLIQRLGTWGEQLQRTPARRPQQVAP